MKVLVSNYTFNAAAKTVTFTDYSGPGITLERILVVSNVTDGILIFDFADPGITGTVATNVLTVTYDTTPMSNGDKLCIIYDDPAITTQPADLTKVNGAAVNVGQGTAGAGTQRVAVASDSSIILAAGSNIAGKFGIDQTTAGTTNAVVARGGVAHGGTDVDNPVKAGLKARTTNPTALADGKVSDLFGDKLGKAVVVVGAPRELVTGQNTTITSSTAETEILAAGAGGVFHDLTDLVIVNTSATDVEVDIRDATGDTVRRTFLVRAKDTAGFAGLSVPMKSNTAAGTWTAKSSASVASLKIFVQAVKVL